MKSNLTLQMFDIGHKINQPPHTKEKNSLAAFFHFKRNCIQKQPPKYKTTVKLPALLKDADVLSDDDETVDKRFTAKTELRYV